MKVLFSMINYVYHVYAIFLNGGILVPLVVPFADAEQQGIRAVANNNHEGMHQQEGKEEKDHYVVTSKTIVDNNDLSIRYENIERFLKGGKKKFFETIVDYGPDIIEKLIDNNGSSTSSCLDDLSFVQDKRLPTVDSNTASEACKVVDSSGFKWEVLQTVSIDCDYKLSLLYLNNFKLLCEDSKLFMTLFAASTYPGDDNVYIYYEDPDILNELYHLSESNVPICLPRSCSYTEAKKIVDLEAEYSENVNDYERVSYILNTPYDPTSGASTLSTGIIVAIIFGIGGALVLMLYVIRNHKKKSSAS